MPLLVLLLIAGVVEVSVLVFVGQAIGALPTVGLLIAAAVLGSWLLRREGRRTLREISEAARLRRPPTREFADGALIAIGGILIVLPGFVSDVAGLLCLLPPTRALFRRRIERSAEYRAQAMRTQMGAQAWPPRADPTTGRPRTDPATGRPRADSATGRRDDGDVIEGEVVSVSEDDDDRDEQQLPRRNPSQDDERG